MKLSEKDKDHFFKLYHSLLIYANEKYHIINGIKEADDLFHCEIDKIYELRMKLYDHPKIMDSFVKENPRGFDKSELEIIDDFKHFMRGSFIIVKYLNKYSVLLSQDEKDKALGVMGLNSTFKDMLGPQLPVMIDAVLLPFKDSIVFDGLINPYQIQFGGNIRKSINSSYQKAKAKYGIITSLPFEENEIKADHLDMLKVYMKNQYNREVYWEEIEDLKNRDHRLLVYYHQKMGMIHSRDYNKRLKAIGMKEGWFGILEGLIITSGTSKKDLMKNIDKIVPSDKKDLVFMFKINN